VPTLEQWEKSFIPYFERGFRLLGEIPLSQPGLEDITHEFRKIIKKNPFSQSTEILISHFPQTLLIYLTAFGAYNTERDYWGQLADELGVNKQLIINNRWPHFYITWLSEHRKPVISENQTHAYLVGTIRLHGGIPAYSLPDFFARLVLPSIRRSDYIGLPAKKVLDTLLEGIYNVDAPVISFLENSRELGVAYFESCQRMARVYEHNGTLSTAEELNLPEYVVDAFRVFMESEEDSKQHFHKPLLFIAPDDENPLQIFLPSQEIPLTLAGKRIICKIIDNHLATPLETGVHVAHRRQYLVTEETWLTLDFFPNDLKLELWNQSLDQAMPTLMRRWNLLTLSQGPHMMAFDGTGQMLTDIRQLPASQVILVYPASCELHFEGGASLIKDYPHQTDQWRNWRIQAWDLSLALTIWLSQKGVIVGNPMSVSEPLPEPRLRGETSPYYANFELSPLYIGAPPDVVIPTRTGVDRQAALKNLRIEVWLIEDDREELLCKRSIADLDDKLSNEIDSVVIPLSDERLLGANPSGTYRIRLSRPDRAPCNFTFRVWPSMKVVGLPKRLMPGGQGAQKVEFTLILPTQTKCKIQAGSSGVQVTKVSYGWRIVVEPDIDRADLEFITESHRQQVRMPVSIPIPRLKWGLTYELASGDLEWMVDPQVRSIDALLMQQHAALHIRLPELAHSKQNARLELVEEIGKDIIDVRLIHKESLQPTPFSRDWFKVPINPFHDSIRTTSGFMRFDFVLAKQGDEHEQRAPILALSRKLNISDVNMTQVDDVRWQVTWIEPMVLRNRRILVEAAWMPWQTALEYRIPDTAQGVFLLDEIGLPPSRYKIHFFTLETWQQVQKRPPEGAFTQIFELVDPKVRLSELEIQPQSEDCSTAIKRHLEMACIYFDLGDEDRCDLELSKIAPPLLQCTNIPVILGLYYWLTQISLTSASRTFLLHQLFSKQVLSNVLTSQSGESDQRRAYLDNIPYVDKLPADSAILILKHDDQPAVVQACLKVLVKNKDLRIINLLETMVATARISRRDAREVLLPELEWSINQLMSKPASSGVDQLLAVLLPVFGKAKNVLTPIIIRRIFPFEADTQLKLYYLDLLIQAGDNQGFRWMEEMAHSGSINQPDVERLLSHNPKLAFDFFADRQTDTLRQGWIDYINSNFPATTGIIRHGTSINTPVGTMMVESIEDAHG
jgi:hypothetical protein